MTSAFQQIKSLKRQKIRLPAWSLLVAGFLVLYIPSFFDLVTGIWSTDAQAHGPIVFLISSWLLFSKSTYMLSASTRPSPMVGWTVFIVGLLFYALGRSQSILIFEISSLIFLLIGLILIHKGVESLKRGWFVFFFMFFMVPLPSMIVDTLTQPMQMSVSYTTEKILFLFGYSIARSGVVLQIGQYQLLVAEACAGLHTLFTLEALGLLYMNLIRHQSVIRNVTLSLLIVPISFSANVIRVTTLALITYHFGDERGQGFLHGFSGMVLFMSALLLIIGVDSLLKYWFGEKTDTASKIEKIA